MVGSSVGFLERTFLGISELLFGFPVRIRRRQRRRRKKYLKVQSPRRGTVSVVGVRNPVEYGDEAIESNANSIGFVYFLTLSCVRFPLLFFVSILLGNIRRRRRLWLWRRELAARRLPSSKCLRNIWGPTNRGLGCLSGHPQPQTHTQFLGDLPVSPTAPTQHVYPREYISLSSTAQRVHRSVYKAYGRRQVRQIGDAAMTVQTLRTPRSPSRGANTRSAGGSQLQWRTPRKGIHAIQTITLHAFVCSLNNEK